MRGKVVEEKCKDMKIMIKHGLYTGFRRINIKGMGMKNNARTNSPQAAIDG